MLHHLSLKERMQVTQLQLHMAKDYFMCFPTQSNLLKIRHLKTNVEWLQRKHLKDLKAKQLQSHIAYQDWKYSFK